LQRALDNENIVIDIDSYTDVQLEAFLISITEKAKGIKVPQETIAHWVNNAKNQPYPVTRESQKNIWRNFLINFSQLYE